MKEQQDYIREISEMRSMMERSSKFMSLSGLAGIMAGIYALAGAFAAYKILGFDPDKISFTGSNGESLFSELLTVFLLAFIVLVLAVGTAIILSYRKAYKRREKFWNPTAKRLLVNMAVPLVSGGLLAIVLIAKGLIGLIAPVTLVFYGLALYNAGKFTYEEIKSLGLIQVGLGLVSAYYPEYGLLFWALGFGMAHIIYGTYMYYRYEK